MTRHSARRATSVVALVLVVLAIGPASEALAADASDTLQSYARGTWASFAALTDDESGLPADSLDADGTRSVQTSTTNIGAYMWSTLVAIGNALGGDFLRRAFTTPDVKRTLTRVIGPEQFGARLGAD